MNFMTTFLAVNSFHSIDYFIRLYLKNAPLFMSLIRPQEAMLFEKNKNYLKHPIFDFGCGDGFFAQTTFGKKTIDIGLDLQSNPRLKQAKKSNVYNKILAYSGKVIPSPDNSVSTVISNCVLEHIPDIHMSLHEIYRILKPGGYFITSVMTSQWSKNMFGTKIFGKGYADWLNRNQEHHNLLSEIQWDTCFKKNKFNIISKTGYLDKKQSQYLDLFHYLSFPSLISYMFFKKWVLMPKLLEIVPIQYFVKRIINNFSNKNCSAYFYVLQK
jgi:ubiquinone/menaquinone biosynthesis C-methylase UbiE